MSDAALQLLAELLGGWLLLLGVAALAARKGGPMHVLAGRLYALSTLVTALVLVPLCLSTGSLFLAIVAGLAGYLTFAGRRSVVRLRLGMGPSAEDWLGVLVLFAGGLSFIGTALLVGAEQGVVGFVPMAGGFGFLVAWLGATEVVRFRRGAEPESPTLVHHVGMMGVSLALVATVFATTLLSGTLVPDWASWLGPTALAVPTLSWWIYRVRTHGRRATFL